MIAYALSRVNRHARKSLILIESRALVPRMGDFWCHIKALRSLGLRWYRIGRWVRAIRAEVLYACDYRPTTVCGEPRYVCMSCGRIVLYGGVAPAYLAPCPVRVHDLDELA